MKEYVVDVRRFGISIVAGRFSAKSAFSAASQACREVVAVRFDGIRRDRSIDRYNPGWFGYTLRPDRLGFCVLVKGV